MNIDIVKGVATDFVTDKSNLSFLEDQTYEEIRMDTVFEHLWRFQQRPFLLKCFRSLRRGGKLVINWLPDFSDVVAAWEKGERGIVSEKFDLYKVQRFTHGDPGPANRIRQLHKDIFIGKSIRCLLNEIGFEGIYIRHLCYPNEAIPLNMEIVAYKLR